MCLGASAGEIRKCIHRAIRGVVGHDIAVTARTCSKDGTLSSGIVDRHGGARAVLHLRNDMRFEMCINLNCKSYLR